MPVNNTTNKNNQSAVTAEDSQSNRLIQFFRRRRPTSKVDLPYVAFKWTLLPALVAATHRIQDVKFHLVRFFGVSLVFTLMTRWWLFRACNNPGPAVTAENGTADPQQVQQAVENGCCTNNCCCANKLLTNCRNKCGCGAASASPSSSAPPNNTTSTTTPVQNTSQQCESVRCSLF